MPDASVYAPCMDFSTWLDQELGRASRIARHFDITRSAVTQWRHRGVPIERMIDVRKITKGAVTLEDMVKHQRNGG